MARSPPPTFPFPWSHHLDNQHTVVNVGNNQLFLELYQCSGIDHDIYREYIIQVLVGQQCRKEISNWNRVGIVYSHTTEHVPYSRNASVMVRRWGGATHKRFRYRGPPTQSGRFLYKDRPLLTWEPQCASRPLSDSWFLKLIMDPVRLMDACAL